MTAEICVMNRLAVVLAADSATTVTYWGENGHEERYFKGANKIFQLSNSHPIGIMIFDSADLLKVPWEVVIKEFRSELGPKSFNDVSGYAAELFKYIEGNTTMFPAEVQHEAFLAAARSVAFELIVQSTRNEPDDKAKQSAVDAAIDERDQQLQSATVLPCIEQQSIDDAMDADRDELVEYIEKLANAFNVPAPKDIKKAADLSIVDVFKRPNEHMSTAGLVFAGFGDHNVFPAMAEYKSCGLLAGKHVHVDGQAMAIDHETPAWLAPFAQRNMADTFAVGVSFDVYTSTLDAVVDGLASFVDKLGAAAGTDLSKVPTLGTLIAEARASIGDLVMEKARKEHAIPMRRILGALPVDELADLAETLINLQSLKEKVTKPSESVGGPVDVAAITKAEGLVWIKRKHYFDPALNSRYLYRLQTN